MSVHPKGGTRVGTTASRDWRDGSATAMIGAGTTAFERGSER
jgi:hypothetical protein